MKTLCTDYSEIHTSGTALAIGNFDGVHKGHSALLNNLCALAKENGLTSVVYTFLKHPNPKQKLITSNDQKEELIKMSGADILFFEDFEKVKDFTPEEFVKEVLIKKFNIKIAVIGENNRFGKDGKGDAQTLVKLGKEYGFSVIVNKTVSSEDTVCSSTNVRKCIENGDVRFAKKLLGRYFKVSGKVVFGKKLGRTYNFPTANLEFDKKLLYPKNAVYATNVYLENEKYKGITNVGITSFDDTEIKRIETYILDFEGDLYNKEITVEFVEKMRDFIPFLNTAELYGQLMQDKQNRLKITEKFK